MKRSGNFLPRLAADSELPGELLPGESLVELAGENRVLIEHHRGVVEYSRCRIGVALGFGRVLICGQGLELIHMTRTQLVIAGRVQDIHLVRKERP